jgi:hypothetical protein
MICVPVGIKGTKYFRHASNRKNLIQTISTLKFAAIKCLFRPLSLNFILQNENRPANGDKWFSIQA